MTDEKLYELCKEYGEKALVWRRKFAGLLPEVNKRRLYEKKGFSSIFEFAAKLAGMSNDQVRRVLNLEKRFETTPILKEMLVEGKVSVNKLARVASVATPENQKFLATQIELLPNRAVETLVRDFKPTVHVHTLKLSDEVTEKLSELQAKGIDVNELILKFLEEREQKITLEKAQIAEKSSARSRYLPAKVRKIIYQEHGAKCSIENCQKPAKIIHHTQRFSISQNHNPHFLAPLCHEHHLIAHSIDRKFQDNRKAPPSR